MCAIRRPRQQQQQQQAPATAQDEMEGGAEGSSGKEDEDEKTLSDDDEEELKVRLSEHFRAYSASGHHQQITDDKLLKSGYAYSASKCFVCRKEVKRAPLYRLLKSDDPEEDGGAHRANRHRKRKTEQCAACSSDDNIMCSACYCEAPQDRAKRRRR